MSVDKNKLLGYMKLWSVVNRTAEMNSLIRKIEMGHFDTPYQQTLRSEEETV
jgi:hypothetical protein